MADEIKKEDEVKEETSCCCCCEDKADDAAEKCECGCEEKPAECKTADWKKNFSFIVPMEGDSMGVKIGKAAVRVLILVIILGAALFFYMKNDIYNAIYQDTETDAIKKEIVAMLDAGLKDSGFTYTITFVKEDGDSGKGNYYNIEVKDKNNKVVDTFAMYGMYDRAEKKPAARFYGDDQPATSDERLWKAIEGQAKLAAKK